MFVLCPNWCLFWAVRLELNSEDSEEHLRLTRAVWKTKDSGGNTVLAQIPVGIGRIDKY
jgi:hypothetical protein